VCEGGACSFTLSSSSICVAGSLQQQEEVNPAMLSDSQMQVQAAGSNGGRKAMGRAGF
jgi:hypothetical protein